MTVIVRKDGTIYDLKALGIRTKDFIVSSPSPRHETEVIEGQDGLEDLGSTYDARNITCLFRMVSADTVDFPLLRNEIFRIFDSRDSFYLIDSREPGKRWLVKIKNPYTIDQRYIFGDFQVEFIAFKGYAESVGTTLDPLTFDANLWQTGQGLTLDETMYTHSTTSFQIYNAADGVTINPRKMPLEITFKGASSNLTITNTTTGEVWQYKKSTASGDTLLLTGVRSLINGVSGFSDTNHKLVTLAPGYNNFTISGAIGAFTISFAFRFYTL